MNNLTVSLTIWGKLLNEYSWNEWYIDVKKISKMLGLDITHLGVISPRYQSGKVLTVSRKEKEILQSFQGGEMPTDLSCYSLPKDYRTASFDYNLLIVRRESLITIIMKKEYYDDKKVDSLITILNKYIDMDRGQIYEMDVNETPLFYARGANDISFYKTLKVIKNF